MQPITQGDSVTLAHGEMRVTLLTPWSKLYRRTRFSRVGFISEVWYGDVCFTTAEETPDGQRADCGMGLCCEYKCPGLDAKVPVGQAWLKPGVGLVTREAEPWDFKSACHAKDTPTTLETGGDWARFESLSEIVNGYGYHEKRRIDVLDDSIRVTAEFINTGSHEWDLVEYSHNFLSFHGQRIDQHHHLLLPTVAKKPELSDESGTIQRWNGLDWSGIPTHCFLYRYPDTCDASFAWHLYRDNSPCSVAERISEKPCHMQVWGSDRCLSPEAFVPIHIKPGESKTWTREWFFTK